LIRGTILFDHRRGGDQDIEWTLSAVSLVVRVLIHGVGLFKVRTNVGAAVTAGPTGKLRLEIGQADVIRPPAGVDRDRMGAAIVCTVDEKPGRARLPHFTESDFLLTHAANPRPLERGSLKRGGEGGGKPLQIAIW
jgi:hypothetical protein